MTTVGNAKKVVVDYDHHSAEHAVDPFPVYKEMRDKCPVVWSTAYEGFWVLLGYQEVRDAARNDDTFFSGPPGVAIPNYPLPPQIPLETDAPMTQKLRGLLQQHFSPAAAARMEPGIRKLAHDLVDKFIESGKCDFVVDFAEPLPAITILRMFGYEEEQWAEFVEAIQCVLHEVTVDPGAALTAALKLYEHARSHIAKRREEGFGDDLVSVLLQSTIDGEPLPDEITIGYLLMLLFGGLDTTTGTLANSMIRIQAHPEIRAQLLADPTLFNDAVEEFLRLDSPVQALARTLAHDHDMCGLQMKKGDRALLLWGAADRDPLEYPEPDELRFDRGGNRHLAFGVGLHRCLGSHLGRTMFRVMLETVLERMPDFELDENPSQYRFVDSSTIYSVRNLPGRFTPGLPRTVQEADR